MRQHTAIGCTLVMAVLGLAGCSTLNDVVQEKNQGGGTAQVYPVDTDQAWKIALTVFRWEGSDANELPRSKLRGIKPPLAYSHGPPVWRGGCSYLLWRSRRRTLEQPQLDVLAMELRIAFVTALLPHILANDCFIPVTPDGTDAIAFRPKRATPQTLFDGRDAVQALTRRETFDDLDHLGWALARH